MAVRVFLSSTSEDLRQHRASVRDALSNLGAHNVVMENFGAREERPLDECLRLVREESDLFVGVYAHRYGFVPEGHAQSICELEYGAAGDAKIPRFIYLVDENQPWLVQFVDTGESAVRLKAFKAALLKRHMCQTFSTEDHLAARVVADVGRHISLNNATRVGPGIPVPDIGISSLLGDVPRDTEDAWNARRAEVYRNNRGVFLTHFIQPSDEPGQKYDVFIYLIRHKSQDLSDIRAAEFFLGPYWENKVFPATLQNGFIGIATAAYGTFLCVCRVVFNDGTVLHLERYIDFEASRATSATA